MTDVLPSKRPRRQPHILSRPSALASPLRSSCFQNGPNILSEVLPCRAWGLKLQRMRAPECRTAGRSPRTRPTASINDPLLARDTRQLRATEHSGSLAASRWDTPRLPDGLHAGHGAQQGAGTRDCPPSDGSSLCRDGGAGAKAARHTRQGHTQVEWAPGPPPPRDPWLGAVGTGGMVRAERPPQAPGKHGHQDGGSRGAHGTSSGRPAAVRQKSRERPKPCVKRRCSPWGRAGVSPGAGAA